MRWINWVFRAGVATTVAGVVWAVWPVDEPDRTLSFDFRPTYGRAAQPQILIDDGHLNWHKSKHRLLAFTSLATRDGSRVYGIDREIDAAALRPIHLLVVANPLGYSGYFARLFRNERVDPAFAPHEIEAIRKWVDRGGGLLLAVNPGPAAEAAQSLAAVFGVSLTGEPASNSDAIEFSIGNGSLGKHAVTEKLERVTAFHPHAIRGPAGSDPLLTVLPSTTAAIALQYGKGRVIVIGDATILTSQSIQTATGKITAGLRWPGSYNQDLVLKMLHWLIALPPAT